MKEILAALLALILSFFPGAEGFLEEFADPAASTSGAETTQPENSTFSVTFIDVGQANAALVECDGHYMLVDGGNKDDSSLMYSFLKEREITELDLVVGTHPHEDHIGGLAGALNYAEAKTVLCSVTDYDSKAFCDFKKYVQKQGGEIVVPEIGAVYELGNASVTILSVNCGNRDDYAKVGDNNSSIILRVDYGETSFLFTGDAEREAEQAVLNSETDLSATVLSVGHHGSNDSTTYPFLREVMPQYGVISVGCDNSYGHPGENTLSRLRDAGTETYRTDLHGNVTFTSNGTVVSVTTTSTEKQ